ncbi:circularly permuted type 2 ATP-grasp protein [Pseudooceanicola sp.]|uniref:circularly permuted type 2 ATP-grasp protein n=1 Tax=Pseudooceanicola sp. TaxID=1914328 RepID=UPI002627AF00|nr:circularly permuted type 2 ATP-grasp protein [Pseudooceanicola sp.]MDF1853875.1 circularly permuted type 2 ATP-grasp protein [Pseudooceanicola sp.]
MQTPQYSAPNDTGHLLANYRAQVTDRDEMLRPDGSLRPVWADLLNHISGFGAEELQRRFARGDQYLRNAGVLFRKYDDSVSSERDWPLSHMPVLLDETEWATISAGLIQRADLLEDVVRDLYGANTLVASGQLPATLLTQNPAWLRPMVGVTPASGQFLNFLSFEIGRGPNGKWWVIGDMIEAPGGAGFAVENRVAMRRVFPNFFANANIHRLAGFFQDFQQSLLDLRGTKDGEVAVLSPGPMNEGYFEHAYLARYLGLLLVEGEDLIVQDGVAMVRTVAGPKPLSLLWRRLNSALCDPLELNAKSALGTPGLLDAVRRQNLNVVNALGSGVLETRALMAFMPKFSRALRGEALLMPNIATWWCGQNKEQAHVIANRATMMIGSAYSTAPLMSDEGGVLLSTEFKDQKDAAIADMLRNRGRDLVGQEAVTLSTAPVWENGQLVPRPMCLRVFLGRTDAGWQVMPGGYARVSAGNDATAFAMQRGGQVADVWINSAAPVPLTSMLSNRSGAHPLSRVLPSRAADNLFWMGRYIERAEMNMRLYRAYFARLRDGETHDAPLLEHMRRTLLAEAAPVANEMAALFEAPLKDALQAAGKVGDRFSPDGMMALKDLNRLVQEHRAQNVPLDEEPMAMSQLLRHITGFSGLVHENMYRSLGWRFLSLGTSIERAANMCTLLSQLAGPEAPEGALDLALEIGDSVISHRTRFSIIASSASVCDLLALDGRNPRSIHYHLSRIRTHIHELPGNSNEYALTDLGRKALQLETDLSVQRARDFDPASLIAVRSEVWALSDLLGSAHLV